MKLAKLKRKLKLKNFKAKLSSAAALKTLIVVLLALPWLFAAYWTVQPAGMSVVAALVYDMPTLQEADWDDAKRIVELRRQVQRHFLDYTVYIPLEDIIAPSALGDEKARLSFFMQNACGRARLYVWIPVKFRLPLLGEKVLDWCWKPRPKSA